MSTSSDVRLGFEGFSGVSFWGLAQDGEEFPVWHAATVRRQAGWMPKPLGAFG